jgi:integrase/recombinase XerD
VVAHRYSNGCRRSGSSSGSDRLTPHRFRHTFAVTLLNFGLRETALQKLLGHESLAMTLMYAKILDKTVEEGFASAVGAMAEQRRGWIPNFFAAEELSHFAEGDTVSWIRLPHGYCRRNPKLHCESDVKCLLCER